MSPRLPTLRHIGPPLVVATILALHTALMRAAALRHTGGIVSYPVDDAFIHLALAKRLAFEGTYGVATGEFAAASSSIGWPLLLAAALRLFGPHAWLPLVLNVASALLLVFTVDAVARRNDVRSPWARIAIGVAVAELTPFPTVVLLGMEHGIHTVSTIALIAAGAEWLAAPRSARVDRAVLGLAALAAFANLWRYESAFPAGILAALALIRRRTIPSAVILGAGALPGTAFGLYAKSKGSLFLPVPVVLKGRHVDVAKLGDVLGVDLMDRLGVEAAIVAVTVLCAIVATLHVQRRGFWSPLPIALVTTIGIVLLHVNFASLGWFYRYESYLLATALAFGGIGLASLVPSARETWESFRASPARVLVPLVGLAVLAMPLRRRAVLANDDTPLACRNVFEQQMQSGRFLQRLAKPAAVNDIGAVTWLGDEPIVDLVGLASLPVARAKKLKLEEPLPRHDVERFTKDTTAAIIYDEWFHGSLPSRWLRVGRWSIDDNKSAAFSSVSIYATEPSKIPELVAALRAFDVELPRGVHRTGRYRRRPENHEAPRCGDLIVVGSAIPELDGSYVVDRNGTITLPGPMPFFVEAVPFAVTRDLIAKRLGEEKLRQLDHVAQHANLVSVIGEVPSAIETSAADLASAITQAGSDRRRDAWIWREREDGSFVRLSRTELGPDGALRDGDVVVVL